MFVGLTAADKIATLRSAPRETLALCTRVELIDSPTHFKPCVCISSVLFVVFLIFFFSALLFIYFAVLENQFHIVP